LIANLIRLLARLTLSSEWGEACARIDEIRISLREHPDLIPPLPAQRLLVSGEDRRHGRHAGFDLRAIARAIFRRLTSSHREGGSTIEQQIVRVVTNRFERTWRRKIREILLSALVAEYFSKAETPALYLAIGYYGWRMNNFIQACHRLRLRPDQLTIDDAAALVARLKYPEPRTPPPSRVAQISQRKEYLKRLYRKHMEDGTYLHIGVTKDGKAILRRGKSTEVAGSAPYA
jgi:membrane peptidoglycan carboxypeptidase